MLDESESVGAPTGAKVKTVPFTVVIDAEEDAEVEVPEALVVVAEGLLLGAVDDPAAVLPLPFPLPPVSAADVASTVVTSR
jgi:hypothetical protein